MEDALPKLRGTNDVETIADGDRRAAFAVILQLHGVVISVLHRNSLSATSSVTSRLDIYNPVNEHPQPPQIPPLHFAEPRQ